MNNTNGMMLSLIAPSSTKPNRLETREIDKDNDPMYSLNMAKWIINNANNVKYQDHVNRMYINKKFYKNEQWFLSEDIEAFLKDEDGLDRNRLRVTMNLIQQMGNMYRGTVDKMDFNGRVKSYSPNVKTRRDAKLEEMLMWGDVAKDNESLRSYVMSKFPIGKTEDETKQIFENIYKDKFVHSLNDMLQYCRNVNNFNRYKQEFAEDEFYSGMCVAEPMPYGGEWVIKRVQPERFFWDRSAIEYDLSDAQYGGTWEKMLPTEIYERFPNMDKDDRAAIEKWIANWSASGFDTTQAGVDGRVPVFTTKWRDCTEDWYGYVKNEFDDIVMVRLNQIPEGETKAKWTEKYLIKNKDLTISQRKKLKIKANDNKTNKTKIVVDYWRYCIFIPQVYAGIYSYKSASKHYGDIVLEHGILDYQEPDLYSPTNMKFPYKVGFYIYLDGEVVAPVDIAINPQRMINRFLSVFENQVNNSGGSNVLYDEDSVTDEVDFLSKVKRSEPVGVRSKGMPMQNVVTRYDNTIGQGAAALIQYANLYKTFSEEITGVNNAVKGQASNEQLVGVMQLQIQKGTLLQEPFYKCIENVFEDCYQNMITAGKRFYLDNKDRLLISIGEEETRVLELTEDLRWEDGLVTVKRSADPENERTTIDAAIIQFMQLGLLTDVDVSNLLGRATMDDVYASIRDAAKLRIELKRIAGEQQQQLAQQSAIAQQVQGAALQRKEVDNRQYEMYRDSKDKQHEAEMKVLDKGLNPTTQNTTQPV